MKSIFSIDEAMVLAIEEAKKGLYYVSPNPPVGCVILDRDFKLLAKGFHKKCGEAHAEIDALNKVMDKKDLEGAHIVVTLEPCAHRGRTGSCAQELAKYPIDSVIYGLQDPNPLVAGKGAQILKAAGIKASVFSSKSDLIRKLELLIDVFKVNILDKRTYWALKVASSIDGQMAHQSGESKWITNEFSRNTANELRARYDAVLVGKNTLLVDDPNLNIRVQGIEKINKVIVIDPAGESLNQIENFNILKHRPAESIYLIVSERKFKTNYSGPINIIYCPESDSEGLDLSKLSQMLFEQQINSVFIEGGAHALSEFFQKNCVDRFYYFLAPCVIGSKSGLSWTKNMEIPQLNKKLDLRLNELAEIKGDVFLDYSTQ